MADFMLNGPQIGVFKWFCWAIGYNFTCW